MRNKDVALNWAEWVRNYCHGVTEMWKNRAVKLQYQMKSHALQILQRLVVRRLTIRLLASWRKAHTQLLSLLGTRATVVSELWFKNANLSRPFKAWQTEKLAE